MMTAAGDDGARADARPGYDPQTRMLLAASLPRTLTIGGIVLAALVGGTSMVITMAGMQGARAVAGPAATPLMAVMTSAFGAGQIVGPLVATSTLGADAQFSGGLLVACLLLLGTAALLPSGLRDGASDPADQARTSFVSWGHAPMAPKTPERRRHVRTASLAVGQPR